MKQRGRDGEAEQVDQARPEPPARLSGLAAEEWRAVVAAMPGGYFTRETWPMLIMACEAWALYLHHTDQAALVTEQAKDNQGLDVALLSSHMKLAAAASKEYRLMATALRLSPQSQEKARGKKAGEGLPSWLQHPEGAQ